MKTVYELAEKLGLQQRELLPHGHHIAKIDFKSVLDRLSSRPNGKYVDVTAITPTPLGEGKSTSNHWVDAGTRQARKERHSYHPPAVRRPDHEHQRLCSRRRTFAVHTADAVFSRFDRRYQCHHECAQSCHGRPHLAHAA